MSFYMAEVKGKFISLAGNVLKLFKNGLHNINPELVAKTEKNWSELNPEGWYDTKIFNLVLEIYSKYSSVGEESIVLVGKSIYPLVKQTVGFPSRVITPLDLILYEAEGFLANHRGNDVVPRKFIRKNDRDVLVEAPAPGYNSKLYIGVYLGILEMFEITTGKVVQTKSIINGDATDEFHITW